MAYKSFEELEVWQKSCHLSVKVYEALINCRDYGLKDQMTRSTVSIASNIAEGAERGSKKEFIGFLHIAKGSSAELRTQLYIATKIGILSKEIEADLIDECKLISKMLHSLIKSLKD